MFGIGLSEFILILIVALIALGPEKLPGMAKALGKAYSDLRKAGEEVKRGLSSAAAGQSEGEKPAETPVPGQGEKE